MSSPDLTIKRIITCENKSHAPSRRMMRLLCSFSDFFSLKKTTNAIKLGMMRALKIAEPATVAIPEMKPSESPKTTRNTVAVISSGREDAIALIVAPRTPGLQPRPHIFDAIAMPLLDHLIHQLRATTPTITAIKVRISMRV